VYASYLGVYYRRILKKLAQI